MAYYERVWLSGVPRDIQVKPRKYGFTTLRVGLGYHKAITTEGHIFRVFLHDKDAAEEVKDTINLMHETALGWFERIGEKAENYLPSVKYDNRKEYAFSELHSSIYVDTARGDGVGQSDISHDIYLAEYAQWPDAEKRRSQIAGSIPPGIGGRISICFNADGIGNDAYVQYQKAKQEGTEDWNGYKAVFFGVGEFPEVYSKAFLEAERKEHQDRFPAIYPSNDEECWLQAAKSVHDWKAIQACHIGKKYLFDALKEKYARNGSHTPEEDAWGEIRRMENFHGVDTATGKEDGDFSVMKSRTLYKGHLYETCPPIRERTPEHVFAEKVWNRWKDIGGMLAIEANVGSAVLLRIKQLGASKRGVLYRHRDALTGHLSDAPGFPMNRATKRACIADYDAMIKERSLDIVSENGAREAREYEWKDREGVGIAGAPDLANHHDDEIMADYICVQMLKSKLPTAEVI